MKNKNTEKVLASTTSLQRNYYESTDMPNAKVLEKYCDIYANMQ